MVSAVVFAILAGVVAAFQTALVAGAPWGSLTMGGQHPGRLPSSRRAVAAFSAIVLAAFALIVLTRAGMIWPHWQQPSRWLIWLVVAYCAMGCIANAITPSKWERRIWLPIVIAMLITSVTTALSS